MVLLAVLLAVLFIGAGIAHVLVPRYFVELVPPWLPAPRILVAVSAVADVATGLLLLDVSTRAAGATAAAALLVVYLVSHVDAFLRRRQDGPLLLRPWFTVARVVVNAAYLAAALSVAIAG